MLARIALVVTTLGAVILPGCSEGEAPAPEGAAERVAQRAMEENRAGAGDIADRAPEPLPEPAGAGVDEPVKTDAPGGTRIDVGGISMVAPNEWEREDPTSSMRAAQYKVGQSGAFVIFQGIGGGVEANMSRWIGQMSGGAEPTRDTVERDGLVIHTVEMTGTYQGMNMMGSTAPEPDTTFYGAIVEGADVPIQIRLTIGASEAQASEAGWDALVNSIGRPG